MRLRNPKIVVNESSITVYPNKDDNMTRHVFYLMRNGNVINVSSYTRFVKKYGEFEFLKVIFLALDNSKYKYLLLSGRLHSFFKYSQAEMTLKDVSNWNDTGNEITTSIISLERLFEDKNQRSGTDYIVEIKEKIDPEKLFDYGSDWEDELGGNCGLTGVIIKSLQDFKNLDWGPQTLLFFNSIKIYDRVKSFIDRKKLELCSLDVNLVYNREHKKMGVSIESEEEAGIFTRTLNK